MELNAPELAKGQQRCDQNVVTAAGPAGRGRRPPEPATPPKRSNVMATPSDPIRDEAMALWSCLFEGPPPSDDGGQLFGLIIDRLPQLDYSRLIGAATARDLTFPKNESSGPSDEGNVSGTPRVWG
jgi:hypothetical protein